MSCSSSDQRMLLILFLQTISKLSEQWWRKRTRKQKKRRNLSLLRKAAKRTTGACRLPSPSGPRSFTRRAVGPQPPLCSPEASLPAQMCSCLCGAAIKPAGLPSIFSKWTEGVATLQTYCSCGRNWLLRTCSGTVYFLNLSLFNDLKQPK